ncbi:serine/threonine-protein kinase [Actinocrispum wychmicini]|uniref:non-specific serine/threonine protein kinase n=1 Tax=Actinocrispum wychmicini TaxID=1213861 RepID=A0A4R2JNK3_9PSEU|nr:serine/threonine-protein kinase [Actinocrispum wychmicini]TCO60914.1 serine/threonine protein kinase [Actinocrispum wychmicini]
MTQETQPGRVVAGRYRLLGRLGAGGFGRVWRAHDEALGVDVAVKEVWLPALMSAADRVERLARAEREARNAAQLRDHPNIIAVHDIVIDNGVPWTVMRLVEGRSLDERIDEDGPLSVGEAATVAVAVLQALGAAHQAGITHRDVKPANIMLTIGGQVLLTDFGIAVHSSDTALTATGMVVGSMEYVAPERVRGAEGLAASDLFALGATLYQAVEGFSPFRRDTTAGTLGAVLFDHPPAPQRAGRLADLIMRLLAKDPGQRPSIPQALALAGEPVAAVAGPAPTKVAAPTRGRRPLSLGERIWGKWLWAKLAPPGQPVRPGVRAATGVAVALLLGLGVVMVVMVARIWGSTPATLLTIAMVVNVLAVVGHHRKSRRR